MRVENRGLGLAATAMLLSTCVHAQDAGKPIRFLVPFPPGGSGDTLARTVAQPLSRVLRQNVVVENRTGGNTVIATELLARAPADGLTMNVVATSFTVNPFAYNKLPYDSLRDFSGVTLLAVNPLAICVHPSLPVKNVKELVALARARPGELTWAVSSIIGGGRIAGEMFVDAAKIRMTNVPYGGGAPAAVAVIGGHTSMLINNVLDCAPYVENGRLRPVAVTSAKRSEAMPNVPTVAESGYPGFEVLNWFGVIVRSGTPRAIVDRLSSEIGNALQLPEAVKIFSSLGMTARPMSPAEFDTFIRREMEGNEKIIRRLNLKVE
jgi:tripartite-type tricarboxylate transporter receptor subunit TctC